MFSISLLENAQTFNCHAFGIFGRFYEPQTDIIYLWRHHDARNNPNSPLKKMTVGNLGVGKLDVVGNVRPTQFVNLQFNFLKF